MFILKRPTSKIASSLGLNHMKKTEADEKFVVYDSIFGWLSKEDAQHTSYIGHHVLNLKGRFLLNLIASSHHIMKKEKSGNRYKPKSLVDQGDDDDDDDDDCSVPYFEFDTIRDDDNEADSLFCARLSESRVSNNLCNIVFSEEAKNIFNWINCIQLYVSRNDNNNNIRFETFQKRMIMQTIYFVAKVKCPKLEKDLTLILNHIFDVDDFDVADQGLVVDTNQNKIATSVVPRRHGKSFIITIILASCLLSMQRITLSYISPIFKLNFDKFDEILTVLHEMNSLTACPINAANIVVNRQTRTISIFHDDSAPKEFSSLSFVCCHLESVSIVKFVIPLPHSN